MKPSTKQGLAWASVMILIAISIVSYWHKGEQPERLAKEVRPVAIAPTAVAQTLSAPPALTQDKTEARVKPKSVKKQTLSELPQETNNTEKTNFQKLIDEVKADLPKQSALRQLNSEQTHYVPEVIQKAALRIGDIAQAIADNKRLTAEGFIFYQDCAENSELPESIRATCVVNHETLLKSSGASVNSLTTDPKISENIISLAKKLL